MFRVVEHVRGGGINWHRACVRRRVRDLPRVDLHGFEFQIIGGHGGAYSFVRLVCKERVVECREDRQIIAGQFLDAELAANKIPIKKSDPSSMPARSCRDVLSPTGFRNTTKRDDAKRGDDLDRERKEKRERERERFEERKRKVRDRPTFLYLFF